eukprot:2552409-Rhodomonas_salina.1
MTGTGAAFTSSGVQCARVVSRHNLRFQISRTARMVVRAGHEEGEKGETGMRHLPGERAREAAEGARLCQSWASHSAYYSRPGDLVQGMKVPSRGERSGRTAKMASADSGVRRFREVGAAVVDEEEDAAAP